MQFFGIPYAKKPKRFEHAEFPPESWYGDRDASERLSKNYPICPQNCYETSQSWIPKCPSYEEGYQSENCLFLEITVPERLVVEEFDDEGKVVEYESGAGCEKKNMGGCWKMCFEVV